MQVGVRFRAGFDLLEGPYCRVCLGVQHEQQYLLEKAFCPGEQHHGQEKCFLPLTKSQNSSSMHRNFAIMSLLLRARAMAIAKKAASGAIISVSTITVTILITTVVVGFCSRD